MGTKATEIIYVVKERTGFNGYDFAIIQKAIERLACAHRSIQADQGKEYAVRELCLTKKTLKAAGFRPIELMKLITAAEARLV